MVKHIVVWKIKDQYDGLKKFEIIKKIKMDLEDLKFMIPQIKKLEVGVNIESINVTNFDICVYSEFDTKNDFDIFIKHPARLEVSNFIIKVREDKGVVDYII